MCLYLQDQYTPLYAASANGFNDVVKSLIAANADVNYVCKVSFYITVYIMALKYGTRLSFVGWLFGPNLLNVKQLDGVT